MEDATATSSDSGHHRSMAGHMLAETGCAACRATVIPIARVRSVMMALIGEVRSGCSLHANAVRHRCQPLLQPWHDHCLTAPVHEEYRSS